MIIVIEKINEKLIFLKHLKKQSSEEKYLQTYLEELSNSVNPTRIKPLSDEWVCPSCKKWNSREDKVCCHCEFRE